MISRFACALMLLAIPLSAQVDPEKARGYFEEARALCERDAGRLWGAALCGRMVIADARTQTFATNQTPPEGSRPRTLGFVNGPVDWGGQPWAAYVWEFFSGKDAEARGILMVHELFHTVQPQIGLFVPGGRGDHLDSLEGRYWLQLEWRALAAALRLSGSMREDAIRDALAFRRHRQDMFQSAADNERRLEIRESLAQYTGTVIATGSAALAARSAVTQISGAEEQDSFIGSFAYTSGTAYGILLDAASPDWKKKIDPDSDLARMLQTALALEPVRDPGSAAARYDGAKLRAAEEKRDEDHKARVAELRKRFVDGPVLVVPRAGSGSIDSRGSVAIPGSGTVYLTFRLTGEWGTLESTKGVLISEDNKTVALPAPARVDQRLLAGDGWTVTLASGWRLQPGPRPGDYQVVR